MAGDTAIAARRPPVSVRRRPAGRSARPEPVRPPAAFAWLRLTYLDPEKKERDFPKGLWVDLTLSTADAKAKKRKAMGTIGDGGVFTAPVYGDEEKLEIRFVFKDAVYVAVEPQGAAVGPGETVMAKSLDATLKSAKRLFRIPSGLGLDNAPWKLEPADRKFHEDGKAIVSVKDLKAIGTKDKPRRLVLRPVWQYVRLTYYDRFLGGAEQISALPLLLEGHHALADVTKTPVAEARWNVGDDDTKAVQCVPWILNKAGGKAIAPPDKHTVLQLKTKAGTFIETAKTKKRGFTDLSANPAVSRTPNADRLRFYDLPAVWRSAGWYVRDEPKGPSKGKLYEDLGAGHFAGTLDKPLIFSLDDIVLLDWMLKPIAFTNRSPESNSTPNDRWAIYHHGFASGPDLTKEGLWRRGIGNPDTDGDTPYFSEKPAVHVPGPRICEYPDWSRLVLARGNAFDVFDQRTPDDALNKIVGARAAVHWVDANAKFAGITTWHWIPGDPNPHEHPNDLPVPGYLLHPKRPPVTQQPFFAVQPHYDQEYVGNSASLDAGSYDFTAAWTPAGAARAKTGAIGRSDMIALRCCDATGDKELAVVLLCFRFFWKFTGVSRTSTIAGDAAKRKAFVSNSMRAITRRWNGPDGSNNPGFPTIVRKTPAGKLEFRVACVAQSQPEPLSHFRMDVVSNGADGRARSFMSTTGLGELTENGATDRGGGSMAAPHEAGHGLSLPDEYTENWTLCSYDARPLRSNNAPGDPFGMDPDSLMSFHTKDVRGRHYWHIAEWLRKLWDGDWKLVHDSMDFELPKHPHSALNAAGATRTFAYWPMRAEIAIQTGGGKYEVHFYALGKDAFSQTVMGGADGLLLVQLKMRVSVPPNPDWPKRAADPPAGKLGTHGLIVDVLSKLENQVNAALNAKFTAKGKVGAIQFQKVPMRFVPRYVVDTITTEAYPKNTAYLKGQLPAGSPQTAAAYANAVAAIVAANDAHLTVEIVSPPPPPPPSPPGSPPPPPAPPVVSGWVGAGRTHLKLRLDQLNKFSSFIVEFLGFTDGAPNPSPNKANAKVIASKVLTDADIL